MGRCSDYTEDRGIKEMMWRMTAVGTTLLLALIVGVVYGGMMNDDSIDYSHEIFVMTYPAVFLVGLSLWRCAAGRRASPLFRLAAWMAFLLAPMALVAWAGWAVGFGEPFREVARHLLLAAVPCALLMVAYLISFRSIRFAWFNVVLLGLLTASAVFSIVRGTASLGRAFSSYGKGDLIAGVVVAVLAAGICLLNVLAARRPVPERKTRPAWPGPAALWWALAVLAVPLVALLSLGVTARSLSELGSDSSQAFGEDIIASIRIGQIDALRSQLEARRPGVSIPADVLVAAAEAGADLEAETVLNYATALVSAARWSDLATVQALLQLGADPDHGSYVLAETSNEWMTPLGAAVYADKPDILRALLEAGATTETAAGDGISPLIRAARSGRLECARVLVKAGATIDARDLIFNRTALHHAAHWEQREVYQLLLEEGADPTLTDKNGRTAAELLEPPPER
jgi:hypothetical protein